MNKPTSALSRRHVLAMAAGGLLAARAGPSVAADGAMTVSSATLAAADIPPSVVRLTLPDRDGVTLVSSNGQGLEPKRRNAWWFTSNGGRRFWRVEPSTAMTPEMFGAIADGAGDAAPAIEAALEFVAANGVAMLRFATGKTYRLASWVPGSDVSYESFRASIALPPRMRGVTIDLNGCTLLQACDAMTFGARYRMFNDSVMRSRAVRLRGMPVRGADHVSLVGPAPLRPGSIVMLVSGRTYARDYTPIAEMLEVASTSGSSLRFTSPVRKSHMTPKSDPLGLIDISDHHIRDCRLVGPGTVINRYRRAGNVFQALGYAMDRVEAVGRGGFGLRGRAIRVTGCSARIQPNWAAPIFRPYAIAFDTGTSESSIVGFHADGGDNVTYLHLHEGLADISVSDLTIVNGTRPAAGGEYVGAISILGVSENVTLSGIRIENNPQGPAIMARGAPAVGRGNRGLRLKDIVAEGIFAGAALVLDDSEPAVLDGIDLSHARLSRGSNLLQVRGSHRLTAVRLPSA